MTSEKTAKNIINKAIDGVKSAVGAINPEDSRQQRRAKEREREKLTEDMKKQGLTDEQIKYYFFVKDNAQKAQEIFDSMQRLLNKLGYFLQGKIEHNQRDGSMRGAVDIGMLPEAQFRAMELEEEKRKAEETPKSVVVDKDISDVKFEKKPIKK